MKFLPEMYNILIDSRPSEHVHIAVPGWRIAQCGVYGMVVGATGMHRICSSCGQLVLNKIKGDIALRIPIDEFAQG